MALSNSQTYLDTQLFVMHLKKHGNGSLATTEMEKPAVKVHHGPVMFQINKR